MTTTPLTDLQIAGIAIDADEYAVDFDAAHQRTSTREAYRARMLAYAKVEVVRCGGSADHDFARVERHIDQIMADMPDDIFAD